MNKNQIFKAGIFMLAMSMTTTSYGQQNKKNNHECDKCEHKTEMTSSQCKESHHECDKQQKSTANKSQKKQVKSVVKSSDISVKAKNTTEKNNILAALKKLTGVSKTYFNKSGTLHVVYDGNKTSLDKIKSTIQNAKGGNKSSKQEKASSQHKTQKQSQPQQQSQRQRP